MEHHFDTLYKKHLDKTRVLIINDNEELIEVILKALKIGNKNVDFLTNDKNAFNNDDNDFFILESKSISETQYFHPNIVFIGNQKTNENYSELLRSIMGGGILIYDETNLALSEELDCCENFFRKISYQSTENMQNSITTEFGKVPVDLNTDTIKHIEGAKHLCQHLGLLEEDFYEALMN